MRRFLLVLLVAFGTLSPSLASGQGSTASTLRLYLARHGQSTSNVAGLSTGFIDAALTDLGRQQARELAAMLRGIQVDAVYSSTLSRSRDTAEAAAGGKRVTQLAGLRERNWGAFAGKPANDPEFLRRRYLEGDALDGGETKQMFFERVRDSIAEIRRQHPSGTVLVVGHQATNQQVLRALLELTAEESEMVTQANDEIYALDFLGGRVPLLWKFIPPRNLGEL